MMLVLLLSSLVVVFGGSPWDPAYSAMAADVLIRMNATNKLALLHGWLTYYVGGTADVLLSDGTLIPGWHLHDGPQGVANENIYVTAWPSSLTVVQTWDSSMMEAFGKAMGREQYLKGTNVLLGPAVNLARIPWGGRNAEYMGEDPHLASVLVAAEVSGIQSQNVSGCIKHYVFNQEETDRSGMSSNVPDRAARELYYKPFQAAVDAGVGTAMCSYNRVNGTWACENPATISFLKETLGFQGYLMSDWGATHSTVASANAGLDQEMPANLYFGPALEAAVAAGSVPMSRIDDMVMRMLTPMFALNLFYTGAGVNSSRNVLAYVRSPEHDALALTLAQASITLLRNEGGFLPVSPDALRTVAIFGDTETITIGGSGQVIPPYIITPSQGIASYLNQTSAANVTYYATQDPNVAAAAAKGADLVVMVVATDASEGFDRASLTFPDWMDQMVLNLSAVNSNVVVVARCPGACDMGPWKDAVPAILLEMMPGQESGNSIATTIFGVNNPSGKLPLTFPNSAPAGQAYPTETWLSPVGGGPINPAQWPGTDRGQGFPEADYSEDLCIGYRWYDAQDLTPQFEFGYGLSYSTFSYSPLTIAGAVTTSSNATIYTTLCNVAGPLGADVAQLYVGYPPEANEPPKLLKGFQKVLLSSGDCGGVAFPLTAADILIWDVVTQEAVLIPGNYSLFVGASSRDIRQTAIMTVDSQSIFDTL